MPNYKIGKKGKLFERKIGKEMKGLEKHRIIESGTRIKQLIWDIKG